MSITGTGPLSLGSLANVVKGRNVQDSVLQVVNHGVITEDGVKKYKLKLSDGQFCINFSMLGVEFYKVTRNLTPFTIIRVKEIIYSNNNSNNKLFLLSLNTSIVTPGFNVGVKLGNPREIKSLSDVEKMEKERKKKIKKASTLDELFSAVEKYNETDSGIALKIMKSENGQRFKSKLKDRKVLAIHRSNYLLFCQSKREYSSIERSGTFRELNYGLGVSNTSTDLKYTRYKRRKTPASVRWSGDPCIFCKTNIVSVKAYSRRTHTIISSQRKNINPDEVGYMTRNKIANIVAHYNCLFFTPGKDMIQDFTRKPENSLEGFDISAIRKCVELHAKRKCSFCSRPGAVSTCANAKCKKTGWYHFPCGLRNGSVQKQVRTFCYKCGTPGKKKTESKINVVKTEESDWAISISQNDEEMETEDIFDNNINTFLNPLDCLDFLEDPKPGPPAPSSQEYVIYTDIAEEEEEEEEGHRACQTAAEDDLPTETATSENSLNMRKEKEPQNFEAMTIVKQEILEANDDKTEPCDSSAAEDLAGRDMDEMGESSMSEQQSVMKSLEEQHRRDIENIENRHKRELELEAEKRKIEIKEKEIYLKEVERLQAENEQLKTEKKKIIEDNMKLRKKMKVDKKNYEKKVDGLKRKIYDGDREKETLKKKCDSLENEHQKDKHSLDHILNWAKRTDAQRSSDNSHPGLGEEAEEGKNYEPPSIKIKHV